VFGPQPSGSYRLWSEWSIAGAALHALRLLLLSAGLALLAGWLLMLVVPQL